MNLYAPTTHLNLIHLLEFLTRNNMKGPFWVLKDRFSFLFKYKKKKKKIYKYFFKIESLKNSINLQEFNISLPTSGKFFSSKKFLNWFFFLEINRTLTINDVIVLQERGLRLLRSLDSQDVFSLQVNSLSLIGFEEQILDKVVVLFYLIKFYKN